MLIADHPVLDMLNTIANVDGQPHDFWQTDEDVSDWLVRAGWLTEPLADSDAPGNPVIAYDHVSLYWLCCVV